MISNKGIDRCDDCEETKTVKVYSIPTRRFYEGESRELTSAIWCDDCAELNKDMIISDEELRVLAENRGER